MVSVVSAVNNPHLKLIAAVALLWPAAASLAQSPSPDADRLRAEADELTARATVIIESDSDVSNAEEISRAREDFERAATLWQRLGKKGKQGRCLHGIAFTSAMLDDWEAAATAAMEAQAIAEDLNDRELLSLAVGELAGVRLEQGHTREAEGLLRQAADLAREVGDQQQLHTMLHNLASSCMVRRSYQDALDTHLEALEVARQAGLEDKVLSSLIAVAAIHTTLGDPERASRRLTEAIELAEQRSDLRRQAWGLRELGAAQVELELFDEARASYEASLEIRRELGNRRGAAIVVNQLASLERKLGNLDRAYELYLDANTLAVELDDPLGVAITRSNAARVLLEFGRPAEAHSMFAEVLAGLEALDLSRLEISTLQSMAAASLELNHPKRARDEALATLRLLESVRGELADPDLRARYLAPRREVFVTLAEALILLNRKDPTSVHLEAAFTASERVHGRTLLELVKASNDSAPGDAGLERRREQIVAELNEVQRELLSPDAAAERRIELETRRADLDDERRELDGALRRRSATAEEPTPDLTRLRHQLGEDTALLEYLIGDRSSVLLVVTGEGLTAHLLPGRDEIRPEIEALRELLVRPGRRDRTRLDRATVTVGEMLLGPAHSQIVGRDRLVVVPDGALHLLPFEVLSVDGGQTRVLDHWSISTAPSATFLQTVVDLSAPASKDRSLFAVADPALGDPSGSAGQGPDPTASNHRQLAEGRGVADLSPLPEARAEVAEIAKTFPENRRTVLMGEAAQEETVLAHPMLQEASHLHFATHAVASSDLPEHSGLVLGSAGAGDGVLQAFEIFDLSLDADMVVLSGCETALGPELSGEGMMGLTRAFLYAGVNAVVISLWPVEDRSTRELMKRFYQRLTEMDPVEALRTAKLETAADPEFEHPFHWAPFILVGGFEEEPYH